ncbi:MAG: type II secretion system protein GspE, partial [Betaproteobacteria bacterium]|nr:type II secretion system protein GspE [Betaproteobacteria bacterium]
MNSRLIASERPAPQDLQAVEWLSQLLRQSLSLQASDIHLEPFDNLLRVRIRR